MTTYNKAYFIAKFEAIPDERWCEGTLRGYKADDHCALGHCTHDLDPGRITPEAQALEDLMRSLGVANLNGRIWITGLINDRECCSYRQATPKARILAALADLPD